MTVVDNVVAGTEAVAISPSPPSSVTSQGSGVSTNDDQGEIGSHAERSDGGESFKQRDMRELQELLSKLNPMAEEFVPPSMNKQGGANGFNGVNGGFFTVAGSFLPNNNGFGAAGYFPVNQDGGFRRVLRHISLSLLCFCCFLAFFFKLQFSDLVVCLNLVSSVFLCAYEPKVSPFLSCLC